MLMVIKISNVLYMMLLLISSPSSKKHSGSIELQVVDNMSEAPPVLVFRADQHLHILAPLIRGHIVANIFTCSTTVPGSRSEVAIA